MGGVGMYASGKDSIFCSMAVISSLLISVSRTTISVASRCSPIGVLTISTSGRTLPSGSPEAYESVSLAVFLGWGLVIGEY